MWLSQLHIINYKSCNKLDVFFRQNEPTILVGINDCGKSTVLRSIGLLLEKSPSFHFPNDEKVKSDFSNTCITQETFNGVFEENGLPLFEYTLGDCYVLGKFALEDDDIQQDYYSQFSPHLQWILENRENNEIWLLRVFSKNAHSTSIHILTRDALINDNIGALYYETNASLRGLARQLEADIDNENNKGRYKNSEYIIGIYDKLEISNFWVQYRKPDYQYFPIYAYLDWNISMDELRKVAEEAIRNKIDEHINESKRIAQQQAALAQNKIDVTLQEFTSRFAEDFPNITGFKSNIVFELSTKLNDILINKRNTDSDIHLDSQGEGVKRQIWFALIKWTAISSLERESHCKKFIWCFDEPETHLYPKAQRDLFEIIKKVSNKNIQNVISTHSTIFIDRTNFDTIRRFELLNGYTKVSTCIDSQDVYNSLAIRNSDFLFYDKFLVVEGDTEETIVPHMFELCYGKTLADYGVQLINLGGKNKRHQNFSILKQLLNGFNKTSEDIVYLFDGDLDYDTDFTATERDNIISQLIGKQDIEDALGAELWKSIIDGEFNGYNLEIDTEYLAAIINDIPNERINSNRKFYNQLKSTIKTKLGRDFYQLVEDKLPSKGKDSGSVINKYILSIDNVPTDIRTMFEHFEE